MSTACGRPQRGRRGQSHVDACVQGDILVVVINEWSRKQARTILFPGAFRCFV